MSKVDQKSKDEKRIHRITIQWFIIGFILVCLNICAWTSFPGLRTGGLCLDIASGKVPREAEERFLKRIFEDASNQNFDWIRSISHPDFADDLVYDLQQIESEISIDFEVIYGDDLAGTYDRILEFDNGLLLAVYYDGIWPQCPDNDVTDAEINKHLQLVSISVRDNVDWLDR